MNLAAALPLPPPSLTRRVSTALFRRPGLTLVLLLIAPLLWLGVIYLGSLFALLLQSFFSIDPYSGVVVYSFTLRTYGELATPANFDILVRTTGMAMIVTIACGLIAFPIAYYMARYATTRVKAALYLAVMLPLWSSYLVRVYAWKLILAKEASLPGCSSGWGWDGCSKPSLRFWSWAALRSRFPISGPSSCSSISGCPT